jgi:hypothetical protein
MHVTLFDRLADDIPDAFLTEGVASITLFKTTRALDTRCMATNQLPCHCHWLSVDIAKKSSDYADYSERWLLVHFHHGVVEVRDAVPCHALCDEPRPWLVGPGFHEDALRNVGRDRQRYHVGGRAPPIVHLLKP